jgi:signal transduction histidine kinase
MTKPKILFVDDEKHVLDSVRDAFRRVFEVDTASSGAEGLVKLAAGGHTVVVSDFQMPVMNGAQFLAKARVQAPDVIRVLLTGQASVAGAIAAVNDGNVFRFLTKPCPPPELQRAIEDAIEQARLVTADRELLQRKLSAMSDNLCRAERLASLGTMTGAIGHELNNILAAFRMSVAMIKENIELGEAPDPEDLDTLAHVERHLANHARNLLEYGKPRRQTGSTDLAATVRDAIEMLRVGANLKHVAVSMTIPDRPVMVAAERGEVEQVLINLIKNAVEATLDARKFDGRSPAVAIELTATDGVRCTVRDNGIGIPEANLALIFEPYFTTRSEDRGTGLGLFVVKQIAERCRGTLTVESKDKVGTAFTLSLPGS